MSQDHYYLRSTNKEVVAQYKDLSSAKIKVICEYVWIESSFGTLLSKCKILDYIPKVASDCPVWYYGSFIDGKIGGPVADMCIYPTALFKDPFRIGDNYLVMCYTYNEKKVPASTNKRNSCAEVMERVKDQHPWFAIKQVYTLLDRDQQPFGWPKNGHPGPQGPAFCGVGANKVFGRDIVESHYKACLYAGIAIAGCNEVMFSQWAFQVGPCEGIDMGDHLWVARYILNRVAEDFGVIVSYEPKPTKGDWSGSVAHTKFSTLAMREENGLEHIEKAIEKLINNHSAHIKVYDPNLGKDNETLSIDKFSSDVDSMVASIRIPRKVAEDGKGYLEDRRPSSNCDPYAVTEIICRTVIL